MNTIPLSAFRFPKTPNPKTKMTENLWAPWRMQYLKRLDPDDGISGSPDQPKCFICDALQYDVASKEADDRLVLLRDDRGMIILNRYPYSNGHLLVTPNQHVGDLTDLTTEQRGNLIEMTALAEQTVKLAYSPQGINIGMNIGRVAGAGLPGHLHVHVMPRWSGDTNFITTVGQIRVIPQALEESFELLRGAMGKITNT